MYAHKGRTKKLKRHGLHGFALDQPSINGIGPINRSEKNETVGKQSETVGNYFAERRCDLRLFPTVSPWTPLDLPKKKLRCAEMFFLRNAGWTSFGLIMFPTVSDRFRPFPTVSFFLND